MKEENLYFHESTVVEFTSYPTFIRLCLEDIHAGEQIKNAELLFEGVKKLEVDDKPAVLPLMAAPDGEILTLKMNDNTIELLIEWNNFECHDQFVKYYFIECENIVIKLIE